MCIRIYMPTFFLFVHNLSAYRAKLNLRWFIFKNMVVKEVSKNDCKSIVVIFNIKWALFINIHKTKIF